LVFRERPEVIELAERIMAAADRADSEVLFELELIEVNHSDALLFGPTLNPYSVSLGLAKGDQVVASGLSAGDSTANLVESFRSLESVYTLPTAIFDFQKTLVDSEILATPKIRVKNREKAKVHVGTREPVITVTTTGETSTDNIQYVDVGVKLDIEPRIQLDGTVVTNLSLEVSSVTEKTTTANGSLALSISTTNAQTALTLKDGERTVIGGLIRDDNTKTRKIIPLLGDLPLIGRLFTNHNKDKKKREILLSVTTHILQNADLPGPALTDIWSGSEDDLKPEANFASFQTPIVQEEGEETPAATEEKEKAVPAPEEDSPAAAETPENPPPAEPEQPGVQEETIDEPAPTAFTGNGAASFLLTAPRTVAVGETFEILVGITDITDLHSAPLSLSYNRDRLEVLEISEGDFLGREGGKTLFSARQSPDNRGYAIDHKLLDEQAGTSGSGSLARVLCKATNPGRVLLGVEGGSFQDSLGKPLTVPAQNIFFNVE
jgi:general secretion pathway protein D